MPVPLRIVPALSSALGPSYTEMALAALDEARKDVLTAEKNGKPCTHLVICMVAEFESVVCGKGTQHMVTQWVTSENCGDLAALGVLDMVAHDMKGSS